MCLQVSHTREIGWLVQDYREGQSYQQNRNAAASPKAIVKVSHKKQERGENKNRITNI